MQYFALFLVNSTKCTNIFSIRLRRNAYDRNSPQTPLWSRRKRFFTPSQANTPKHVTSLQMLMAYPHSWSYHCSQSSLIVSETLFLAADNDFSNTLIDEGIILLALLSLLLIKLYAILALPIKSTQPSRVFVATTFQPRKAKCCVHSKLHALKK